MKYFAILLMLLPIKVKALTLEEFLNQVKENNSTLRAANAAQISAALNASQAALITSPQLYAFANEAKDKSPTNIIGFYGNQRNLKNTQFGVQTLTDVGLSGKVYFNQTANRVYKGTLLGPGQDRLTLNSYNVELNLPLLKNGFGRDVRLRKNSIRSMASSSGVLAEVRSLEELNRAEKCYYKVSKILEVKRLQEILVQQGLSLVNWSEERVRMRLLEDRDLAQSRAALTSRRLRLEATELELKTGISEFNYLQDQPENAPLPKLDSIRQRAFVSYDPAKKMVRKDIKGTSMSIAAEQSDLSLQKEQTFPDVTLTAKAAKFLKTNPVTDTSRCACNEYCTQLYVGVQFQMPIDYFALRDVQEGVEAGLRSRKYRLEGLMKDAEMRRKSNLNVIGQLRKQMEIARRLINIQYDRLLIERTRQKNGRASTFDLIRAEQDLAEAKINYLQLLEARLDVDLAMRYYEETV
jgi:outer membrane protein TolC